MQNLNLPTFEEESDSDIKRRVAECTDQRIFAVFQAIKRQILDIQEIHSITKIDLGFFSPLENLA